MAVEEVHATESNGGGSVTRRVQSWWKLEAEQVRLEGRLFLEYARAIGQERNSGGDRGGFEGVSEAARAEGAAVALRLYRELMTRLSPSNLLL